MSAKREYRQATYPEICLAGPVGELQRLLVNQGEIRDIHDLASRIGALMQSGQQFHENKTELFIQWSLHQWQKSNKPVFVLEEDLAWSLTHTEPPMENFDLLPEIPIDGMYISLPPVFEIYSGQEGFKIEGVILTRNEVLVPKDGSIPSGPLALLNTDDLSGYDILPSITVLGIGEDKRPPNKNRDSYLRDDLVMYFSLVPGKPLYQQVGGSPDGGLPELTRVVVNLLYLLQNTKELTQEQDPPLPDSLQGNTRTARRERERHLKKGRTGLRHIVWKLSSLNRERATCKVAPDSPDRKISGHIVLGHIHRYWVVDPKDNKVLQTKTADPQTKGFRTYHLVAKWILPYRRGEGTIEKQPKVILRK